MVSGLGLGEGGRLGGGAKGGRLGGPAGGGEGGGRAAGTGARPRGAQVGLGKEAVAGDGEGADNEDSGRARP